MSVLHSQSQPPVKAGDHVEQLRALGRGNAQVDRFVRMDELRRLTGLGASTIYEWMQAGRFPRNVRIGARTVAWRLSEVQAWIDSCIPTSAQLQLAVDRA